MTELTKADKIKWRQFLASEAGIKGMLFMREKVPSINKGDADGMIFDAGLVEGYKLAMDRISDVLSMEEVKDIKIENE